LSCIEVVQAYHDENHCLARHTHTLIHELHDIGLRPHQDQKEPADAEACGDTDLQKLEDVPRGKYRMGLAKATPVRNRSRPKVLQGRGTPPSHIAALRAMEASTKRSGR
jgi:hypothetical protein